jgi:hypothetical protein
VPRKLELLFRDLASESLFITFAREDGEARILGEAGIREGELAEDEDGTTGRFDAAGMKAIGTEAGTCRILPLLLHIRHENKDNAVRGTTIVRMNRRPGVSRKEQRMRIAVRIAVTGWGLLAAGAIVHGQATDPPQTTPQTQQPAQTTDEINAVPNRPTLASTAEMVQLGVFEIEFGFEAAKGHQNINGLLKWGAAKNLELWFLNNPIERDVGTSGVGDSGAGFKYKLFPQKSARPTVAVLYVATLPTARPALGAGALAHLVQILVSKDFGKHHFDVNEGVQFVGRSQLGGFDRTYFTALSYFRPLSGKWGYTGEIAGFSRLNAATPATLTLLNAGTYNLSPRLVLDGGAYFAAYGQLPRITVFAGVTYSIANLYHRHPVHPTLKN